MNILPGGIDAAKDYARRGWPVVILHGNSDGVCTCRKGTDCPSPAKHPRQNKWQERATADEQELERLFAKWPLSNLGVRLGQSSGIVDVEYDTADGEATAERLLSGIRTPTFRSHRSTHRLFRFPTSLTIPKAVVTRDDLEMRFGTDAKGSQSVFPPSIHASGVRYRWLDGLSPEDVELAAFPRALAELLNSPETNGDGEMSFTMGSDRESLSTHPGSSQGERNKTLCRLVGAYLKAHGADADLPTLAMAWGKRCSPPMDDAEVFRVVTELADKELAKGQPNKPAAKLRLSTRRYADIESKPIEWLWMQRIALGKLSLIVGQPGLGKTFAAVDLAARVSRGSAFPDGTRPPLGEVAILTAEDSASDTLKPRLDAAGADVSRVHHIDGIRSADDKEHFLSLGEHLRQLDEWLASHPEAKLLVIDPISAFLGNVDSHRNSEVRSILGPVADLAERHQVAIVGITHLSKGQAKAINRVIGSIAFVAAARAAWMVAQDPDDDERRLLLQVKNNIGKAIGLAFRLVGEDQATRVEWDSEPVLVSADDIDVDDQSTPIVEAVDWITHKLADSPVPSSEVLKQAKADGIAERTLKRAKKELGIVSEKEGKHWVWRLPDQEPPDTDDDCFIVT